MGLTIYNSDNEIIYDYSYGMLHAIRDVCRSCKEKQPYQASKKISDGGYGIPFERK